jgi:hypothetical protein
MTGDGKPAISIGRRDVLSTLAAGLAGAVATPSIPAETAIRQREAGGSDSVPRLLDDRLRGTLDVLAEDLVPGSAAAGVPDLLDRVMAVEPLEERRIFLAALGAFEREARDRHGKAWLDLDPSQRVDILRAASTLPSAQPAVASWTPGKPVDRRPDEPAPPANLRDHFDRLRASVARAYAATEPGMRDLGFQGKLAWPGFSGCPHGDGDHP